jgi:hypothetical protein
MDWKLMEVPQNGRACAWSGLQNIVLPSFSFISELLRDL